MRIPSILKQPLIIFFCVLQLLDLATTFVGLATSQVTEVNPLAAWLFSLGLVGYLLAIVYKLLATYWVLVCYNHLARAHIRIANTVMYIVCCVMCCVVLNNLLWCVVVVTR